MREGVAAAEEPGDRPAAHRVLGAEPRHVPPLGLAVLVGDAEADDAEAGVGGVQVPYAAQHIGVDEQSVVVQFDDDVDVPELAQPARATFRPPGQPRFSSTSMSRDLAGEAEPFGELGQGAAVADDDDPVGGEVLLGHGVEQRVHLGGPVAHGHHGDSDPRPSLHHDTNPIPSRTADDDQQYRRPPARIPFSIDCLRPGC